MKKRRAQFPSVALPAALGSLLLFATGCTTSGPMGAEVDPDAAETGPVDAGPGAPPAFDDDFLLDDEFEEEMGPAASDPLEGVNRVMHGLNDRFYFYALKPVAQGYKKVVPEPVRRGASNVFHNLGAPVRFVGSGLQGKFNRAGQEAVRFGLNTTVGVLGIWRPSKRYPNLEPPPEDAGQTLGAWGLPPGPYLVIPILGPTTLRDGAGDVVDYFLDPVSYLRHWEARAGVRAVDVVNSTSFRIGDYEALKDSAIDPYTSLRNAYHQSRANAVKE